MANTYKAIATVEVGSGGAANIDFTNIPQTYDDIKLVLSSRAASTSANWVLIGINGGSDTDVSLRHIVNNNGSIISQAYSSFRMLINQNTYTSNTFANSEIYIANYRSSNNKSMSGDGTQENNSTTNNQQLAAFLWANSAAITRLTLTVDGGDNFAQYSTATIYGIKNS